MNDSLHALKIIHDTVHIHDTVFKNADSMDVLNKVDSFYNNAWLMLLIFGGLLSVIIPSVLTWVQNKQLKLSEEKLNEQNKKDIEAQLNPVINKMSAALAQIQGKVLFLENNYRLAYANYMISISCSIANKDQSAADTLLKVIIRDCLSHITAQDLLLIKANQSVDSLRILKDLENISDGENAKFINVIRETIQKLTTP